jgi:rRNA-processing protein FCF1
MKKSKKMFGVFYDSTILSSVPDGRTAILTHKKYAEADIWNGVTMFMLAKLNKLKSKNRTNIEVANLNKKYAKHYSVISITLTYEVKDE